MIISSVCEADPSREESSILALTKKAQLLSGQANKIQMIRPLYIFKFTTIAKLFFGKGKKKLLCKGKVPSIHGDGLQIRRLIPCKYATNQRAFLCDTSSQTSYFAWLWAGFCLLLSAKHTALGTAYKPLKLLSWGEMLMKKKHRYVTPDVSQLFLHIFKPVSCLLNNWLKLVWRGRVSRFFLFKMFHIHDLD